jgi:hypothetical protein
MGLDGEADLAGMAHCAVRRRVQRRNMRDDSRVLEYSFSPLNAGCDVASRHP